MATAGWSTIESDPGVFTFLLEKLGVSGLQVEEILDLEPSFLLDLSPVHGIIFLFKYGDKGTPNPDDSPLEGAPANNPTPPIWFAHQTIHNACATQALMSVILNKNDVTPTEPRLDIGEPMRDFKAFTMCLPKEMRGEALSNFPLIRDVHNSFSRSNPFVDETTKDPNAPMEDAFHFIAYTQINGTLYELDGLKDSAITHGKCDSQATFCTRVVDIIKARIARYDTAEIRFNCLAVVDDLRKKHSEDTEKMQMYEEKRRHWALENLLRSHNFVGFAGEVLKGVVKDKLNGDDDTPGGEEGFKQWVDEARFLKREEEEGTGRFRKTPLPRYRYGSSDDP